MSIARRAASAANLRFTRSVHSLRAAVARHPVKTVRRTAIATALMIIGVVAAVMPAPADTRQIGEYFVTDSVKSDPAANTTTATYEINVPAGAKGLSHITLQLVACTPEHSIVAISGGGFVTSGDPTTGLTGKVIKWDKEQLPGSTQTYSYTVAGLYGPAQTTMALKSRTVATGTVTAVGCPPVISVDKSASPTSVQEPSGEVEFSVKVANQGNVAVTLTSLADDIYGDLNGKGSCSTGGTITPGASYSCSFNGKVSGEAGDSETDTVTAAATDPAGNSASDTASATVSVTDALPSISVEKSADPAAIGEPGGPVKFSIAVSNTGREPVVLNSLVDDVYGDLAGKGTCGTGGLIAAGGAYGCSFTATVNGAAGSTHTNTVTATASDNEGNQAADTATATVTIVNVPPTISVEKTVDPTTVTEPGGVVSFSVSVNNTSNEDVTLASLTDDVYGDLAGKGTCGTGGTIGAGARYSCSFSAEVTGSAGSTHTDTVTATATDSAGASATASDDATVTVVAAPAPPPPPASGGQVAPTATTCADFTAGTSADLTEVLYGVKSGKVNNVAPGVFFYYSKVTAPSSSFTVDIAQGETHGAFSTLFALQSVSLYDAGCTTSNLGKVSYPSAGQARISVNGATAGATYVIGVKYDPNTVVGQLVPSPSTVHYDFATLVNGVVAAADTDGVNLIRKA